MIAPKLQYHIALASFKQPLQLGHAFARNRARRLMKEVYRLHMAELSPHYEVVMLSGIFLTGATYQQAEKAILSLWRKAGILVK